MYLYAIREKARHTLQGRWWSFAGYTLVILIITSMIPSALDKMDPKDTLGPGGLLSLLYTLLIVNAVSLGINSLYLRTARGEEVSLGMIFDFFTNGRYAKSIIFYLLMGIYLLLWSLLFIIPGIIKTFSYAMAPYLLIDNPQLTTNEAITQSREMMHGHKWELFCLYLTFIGWFLLSLLTLGIGFLWLIPYVETSLAQFYLELKEQEGFQG